MPAKVVVERQGSVAVVTLNRPEVHNAVDSETAALLSEAIETFAGDGDSLVMVVTGAGGRAFCAGADLKDIEALMRPGVAPLGFSHLDPGKPTVAAVEGYCVGGGIELACWCDFAIAGEEAVFGALNRRVGVPWVDGGTQRMTRRIGTGNALYLLESGERIDARRALAIGLVQEVVAAGTALDRALELARRMAAFPQSSLRTDRTAMLAAFGTPLPEGLELEAAGGLEAAQDPELRQAILRFLDRQREQDSGESGAADTLHP